MEMRTLSAADAAEFEEFLRLRKETEAELTIKRLIVDATKRETDRHALFSACDVAKKLGANSVAVSPVNLSAARKRLKGLSLVACVAGGMGESLIKIKQKEARLAMRQGARIIRLVPCYSALLNGNVAYLKREIKKVRRVAKKRTLVLVLDDRALSKEDVERGISAALAGRADAVCVRGEMDFTLLAVRLAAGRLGVETSGVENAEQMRLLLRAGAERVLTADAERVSNEYYRMIAAEGDDGARKENANFNETAR